MWDSTYEALNSNGIFLSLYYNYKIFFNLITAVHFSYDVKFNKLNRIKNLFLKLSQSTACIEVKWMEIYILKYLCTLLKDYEWSF